MEHAIKDISGYARAARITMSLSACFTEELNQEKQQLMYVKRLLLAHFHEHKLAIYIFLMESKLVGLTIRDLRAWAIEYAQKNKIFNNFNAETRLAGFGWVYGFLNRNQNIALCLPKNTSGRAQQSSVSNFFKLLDKLIDEYKLIPNRIYNFDETRKSPVSSKLSKKISLKGKTF